MEAEARAATGGVRPRWLDFLLVKPEVQVRIFDLQFQAEQYAVFHRSWPSRIVHAVCIGPNVFAWFLLAALVPLGAAAAAPAAGPLAATLALPLAAVLTAWYLAMDRGVGLAAAPLFAALWIGANVARQALGPRALLAAVGLMAVCSLAQTVSHAAEPIPPPWSGSNTWVPFADWWRATGLGRKAAILVLFPTVFVGLEWFSSPRLLAVQLMWLLGKVGYRPDFGAGIRARVPIILSDYRNG